MTITLTPDYDPACRAIAQFLQAQLNQLNSETLVEQILDFDGFMSGQGLSFPLLQVFRLSGRGTYLEESELRIEYYLQDPNVLFQNPGILRYVEVAIAHLLSDKLPYAGLDPTLQLSDDLRMQRGFLPIKEVGIFPFTRLLLTLQEVNIKIS